MLSYKFIYLIPSILYIMDKKDNVKLLERPIRGIPVYAILLLIFIITLIRPSRLHGPDYNSKVSNRSRKGI